MRGCAPLLSAPVAPPAVGAVLPSWREAARAAAPRLPLAAPAAAALLTAGGCQRRRAALRAGRGRRRAPRVVARATTEKVGEKVGEKIGEETGGKSGGRSAEVKSAEAKDGSPEDEDEKSIEERFADFTRVLPWFDFAATILDKHAERRGQVKEEAEPSEAAVRLAEGGSEGLSQALLDAIDRRAGAPAFEDSVEASLRAAEAGHSAPIPDFESVRGRWEVVWSGALTPLQRRGFPRQSIWVEVAGDAHAPVLTAYSGLPLVLFGAYAWTSAAGELELAEPTEPGGRRPVLIKFNRYWIDVGATPRADIGRIDGGFVTSRIAAFGAALLTPVLLEFGAVKWLLERFGVKRVFEVEVPSPKKDGGTVKLEASLELYLTLLAMVSFPESLSTCPVPYLDVERGLCVFEIPMLGPAGDLPRWLHPGGNSAALVARRLPDGAEPGLLLDL